MQVYKVDDVGADDFAKAYEFNGTSAVKLGPDDISSTDKSVNTKAAIHPNDFAKYDHEIHAGASTTDSAKFEPDHSGTNASNSPADHLGKSESYAWLLNTRAANRTADHDLYALDHLVKYSNHKFNSPSQSNYDSGSENFAKFRTFENIYHTDWPDDFGKFGHNVWNRRGDGKFRTAENSYYNDWPDDFAKFRHNVWKWRGDSKFRNAVRTNRFSVPDDFAKFRYNFWKRRGDSEFRNAVDTYSINRPDGFDKFSHNFWKRHGDSKFRTDVNSYSINCLDRVNKFSHNV
ncbi:unnamed protein product, partial [Mesorhabditis spiculigera]